MLSKLTSGVMVAQRFLAPFVGVRVPTGQVLGILRTYTISSSLFLLDGSAFAFWVFLSVENEYKNILSFS